MEVSEVNSQKTLEQIINDSASKKNERNLGELGKDDFLNLLVTQLRYQDPMEPMKDQEFISQIAQFSSLEQLQNMSSSFSDMKAFSLLGKHITASIVDENTGEIRYVEGDVTNVKSSDGKTYVVVNGEDIPADRVISVSEGTGASGGLSLSTYTNMIGYKAASWVTDTETGDRVKINGTVKEIVRGEDTNYAIMDGIVANISSVVTETPSSDPDFITDYMEDNVGEEITVMISDKDGDKAPITGVLREYEVDEDGKIIAVLDQVNISVNNIDRVSLPQDMTMDQAILLQILEKLSDSGEEQAEEGDGETPEESPAV